MKNPFTVKVTYMPASENATTVLNANHIRGVELGDLVNPTCFNNDNATGIVVDKRVIQFPDCAPPGAECIIGVMLGKDNVVRSYYDNEVLIMDRL